MYIYLQGDKTTITAKVLKKSEALQSYTKTQADQRMTYFNFVAGDKETFKPSKWVSCINSKMWSKRLQHYGLSAHQWYRLAVDWMYPQQWQQQHLPSQKRFLLMESKECSPRPFSMNKTKSVVSGVVVQVILTSSSYNCYWKKSSCHQTCILAVNLY